MLYLTNLNLNKNELQNARLQNLASPPTNPVEGQIYHNTADHCVYAWNGSSWTNLSELNQSISSIVSGINSGTDKIDDDNLSNNVTDAISKKHSQNTDTGTSSATFQVGSSGVKVKNSGGNLEVRNSADSAYSNITGANITANGTLSVTGNVTLGDDAASDTVAIKAVTSVSSPTTKALGNASTDVFKVVDSADTPLFEVRQNGDTVIGGILTVNGTGTSTFAGDVSIGGNLTVAGDSTATADLSGTDLTLTGNLVVQGDTTLGDNASIDTTTINGVTTIKSKATKAGGSSSVNTFQIKSSDAQELFSVKENGDTTIGGVLTVSGTGTSTFAGDVSIGGKLTVADTSTASADLSGTDLTLTGNLVVQGNTTLGDNASSDTTVIKGVTTVMSSTTKGAGSGSINSFKVVDSDSAPLFEVRQNGDTVIGGSLTVNGTGGISATNDLTLNGDLTVKGNTTLGDASSDIITVKGVINAQGNKITNVADPVSGSDVVTKDYADNLRAGLSVKDPCRVATTANLSATYASNVLTASANGAISIDGIALAINDRVLVKDQTTASHRGIYYVSQVGNASLPWKLTRTTDADNSPVGEVNCGTTCWIEEGTTLSGTRWVLSTPDPITLGTTGLTFTKDFQMADILAGNGLSKSGNTLTVGGTANRITVGTTTVDIASTYAGQTSITTLGTVSTGTWQGTDVGVLYGGTGSSTASGARSNLGATGKYAVNLGNGSATSFVVNHALNTQDVSVTIREVASPYAMVMADVQMTDVNNITVLFGSAPTTNQYRVVVIG